MISPRTYRRVRRAAAASVVTMALFGLSACGSDDSGARASDTNASASSSPSSEASTDKPAVGSELSADDMAALFKSAFESAQAAGGAHLTLSMQGGTIPITAQGDASFGDDAAVRMTMDLASMGQAEVRVVDKTVYMKLPMLGDKFVKFDLSDPNSPLGSAFADQLDPSKLLTSLKGAITKATYVGPEDVKGQSLDHYTVTVDTQKLMAESSLPKSAAGKAGLPDALTYEMWFDDKGRMAQVKADLGTQSGTFEVDFSGWGEKVDVQAPAASDVTDMPGLPSSGASS